MDKETQYSVALAETLQKMCDGDVEERWYHASLRLIRHDKNEGPQAIQRLHFNNANGWMFTPNLRLDFNKLAPNEVGQTVAFEYIKGSEAEILNRWNYALKHS